MGTVCAVCRSDAKGEQKTPVDRVRLVENHGIESDAHAGEWHRQVSLLALADVESMRAKGVECEFGAFAENIVTDGVALGDLGLGSRLLVGDEAIARISQIGKVCHDPCAIFALAGDCIMPRLGLFARVERGGDVAAGDAVEVIERVCREAMQAVVLTISDRCSRGEATDTAGPATAELLEREAKAHIYRSEVLPDEADQIEARLRHYCGGHSIDLVVTVGGTGFTPRDVTPEATRAVVDRLAPGLDEAMRAASLAVTPHAMLSRGVSGICGTTLIVNLPGSRKAAVENLSVVLPALPHAIAKLRGSPDKCGDARDS